MLKISVAMGWLCRWEEVEVGVEKGGYVSVNRCDMLVRRSRHVDDEGVGVFVLCTAVSSWEGRGHGYGEVVDMFLGRMKHVGGSGVNMWVGREQKCLARRR